MKNIHRLVLRAVLSALVLCLPGLSAHADDLSDTLVYAGENEDTINPLHTPTIRNCPPSFSPDS